MRIYCAIVAFSFLLISTLFPCQTNAAPNRRSKRTNSSTNEGGNIQQNGQEMLHSNKHRRKAQNGGGHSNGNGQKRNGNGHRNEERRGKGDENGGGGGGHGIGAKLKQWMGDGKGGISAKKVGLLGAGVLAAGALVHQIMQQPPAGGFPIGQY